MNSPIKSVWNAKSVRFAHGLVQFAISNGALATTAEHFRSAVVATVRRDIAENGTTELELPGKDGQSKLILAKDFAPTQRVSGSGLKQRLTSGEKSQVLTGKCSLFTQRLLDVDETLAGMERRGSGIDWAPCHGSLERTRLINILSMVRKQHEPEAAPAPIQPLPVTSLV